MTHNIPSATFDLPDAVQSINKGDLTRARQFNRRERLNMNGLNREIIGGNYDNTNNASGGASQTYIDPVPGQVMQPPAVWRDRGLTSPLTITTRSAEIQPDFSRQVSDVERIGKAAFQQHGWRLHHLA
ncbi:MAG: hypothetical protein ACHP7O_11675, partial [Burkholderiales bacterium]